MHTIATILVVDDQPMVLNAIKKMLSQAPYLVITAPSAHEALDLLARHKVEVVISDERMPGMPGSEFLSVVRERYPDTVRIILTGYASVEAAIKAINESEIFRFLTKPCTSHELHAAIQAALAHRAKTKSGEHNPLLASLEKQAPGITQVKRDADGVVIIDDEEQ
jgi:two-component system, probable response regulator PhcQ